MVDCNIRMKLQENTKDLLGTIQQTHRAQGDEAFVLLILLRPPHNYYIPLNKMMHDVSKDKI